MVSIQDCNSKREEAKMSLLFFELVTTRFFEYPNLLSWTGMAVFLEGYFLEMVSIRIGAFENFDALLLKLKCKQNLY